MYYEYNLDSNFNFIYLFSFIKIQISNPKKEYKSLFFGHISINFKGFLSKMIKF